MSFRFPGSTNSPSTPNGKGRSIFSQPSTTPAGPPPSHLTQASTTPSGPPPRSFFGSSYNAANNTFGRRGHTPGRNGFAVPESSPPLEDDDYNEEEDAEGSEYDAMDGMRQSFVKGAAPMETSAFMSSIASSPRGLKRSRNGQLRDQAQDEYAAIGKSMAAHVRKAPRLSVSDDVVLEQERIMLELDAQLQDNASDPEAICNDGVARVTRLWAQHSDLATREGKLGPASADPLTRANFVASLLLQLHHPQKIKPSQASRPHRSTRFASKTTSSSCPVPRALLDWLDIYHNPFPDDFDSIHLNQPSPAAHDRFWDIIYSSLSRGKFERAIRLLRDAGWEHAITAQDDYPNHDVQGYSGQHLENIEVVIGRCIRLLETSSAMRYDDWDVKGSDWTVFRQRVQQCVKELETFAGEDNDIQIRDRQNVFEQSAAFGQSMSMSAVSKRAESRVPWSIYENLKLVYGQLLGNIDELIDTSQDWMEACIYLTVWWDGEDGPGLAKSNLRKSIAAGQRTREVDIATITAYQRRLAQALSIVTESEEAVFHPQTLDPLEVAIACVIEDSPDTVISLLRTWNLPVASAVTEFAAMGGWLPQARPRSRGLLEQGFSSEDLMVLSHGPGNQQLQHPGGVDRDDVLVEYAELLAEKVDFRGSDGKTDREGWELAVSVLSRLDDTARGQHGISDMLHTLEFADQARVDKVLGACAGLDLSEQARTIAERYADTVLADKVYGSALIYYARAHSPTKLKDVLSYLISASLLQSAAWPSQANLDPQLAALLSTERAPLVRLVAVDAEAANLLSSHLSGYATLRRVYELRDQDVEQSTNQTAHLRPLERKREVAKALVAITESAADCIRGGLFDKNIRSVVSVDSVLVLLGEALPLLGQDKRIFTKDQVFALIRIVEDFATAPLRIRNQAERMLSASLGLYDNGGSMSGLLTKSRSDLSKSAASEAMGEESYDMLASSIIATSQERGQAANRAWDWRKGLDAVGGADLGASQVIALVRQALASEVARSWGGIISW